MSDSQFCVSIRNRSKSSSQSLSSNKISSIIMDFSYRVVFLKCLFLLVSLSFISYAAAQQQIEQDILKKILGDPYDKRIRPVGKGENASDPVVVTVNFYVRAIDSIDDAKMTFSVQLTFRQQWNDLRLNFQKYNPPADLSYLTLLEVENVWKPDLFFTNEKQAHRHEFMAPNHYVRISPDGTVLYSSRISMTLSCPMSLTLYPFDYQTCQIRLASYGYTNRDIKFVWKQADPVQVTTDLHLPSFSLVDFVTDYCDSTTNTGTYSCLKVGFQFHRELNYFAIHVYIPCIMLVIISWTSFWLDRRAVTARVLLGISSLLVMSMQVSSFNKLLPAVSYTKAIDVWTGISLTFVFVSLLEFFTVNYLGRMQDLRENSNQKSQNQRNGNDEEIPLNHITTESEGGAVPEGNKPMESSTTENNSVINKLWKKYWSEFTTTPEKLDGVSRILFPLAFLLFNIIYWSVYN